MRRQVMLFGEQYRKPAPNGIARNACAIDTAAYNQEIHRVSFIGTEHWLTDFLSFVATSCRSKALMFASENIER